MKNIIYYNCKNKETYKIIRINGKSEQPYVMGWVVTPQTDMPIGNILVWTYLEKRSLYILLSLGSQDEVILGFLGEP